MNRRRTLLAGLASGGGALLVAACGSGAGQGGAPPKSGACKGTLEVISPWNVGSTAGDGINLLGQDFAAAHPGCAAQLLFVSGDNNAILEKLVTTVAAGSQPPVALVPAQQTPLWISRGVIQPLDAWAKRDGVTKDLFVEGYLPQMVIDGKLWRLPFNIDVNFPWFQNKQAFRAAGADPSQLPRTIDELDALATRLTRGSAGAFDQIGFVPWQLYGLSNSFQSWTYAFGGEFYDPAKDKITVNQPKTVQALEWMVGWARKLGGYDAVENDLKAIKDWTTAFAQAKIAMACQTSSGIADTRKINPSVEMVGGLFPGGQGVKPGEATWLSGRGIGVVMGAKDPDSAWAFVNWAGGTKEGTLAAVQRINATPGLKASPGLALLEKDPESKPFVDSLRVAKHNPPGAILPITIVGGDRVTWLTEVMQQKRSAQQTLDDIARAAQVELDAERARQKK